MKTKPTENFFCTALREAMQKHHFNQAQLAEHLRVDPAYISRWLKGSSPRIDQMIGVLATLGWQLDRARPEYNPFEDALSIAREQGHDTSAARAGKKTGASEIGALLRGADEASRRESSPPVTHTGSLDSASGQVLFRESPGSQELDTVFGIFPALPYASRSLTYITVSGNGLAPMFRDGTRVILRRITKQNEVPDGTVVVMETARRPATFQVRRLVRVIDEREDRVVKIIGAPVTDTQDFLFFRPRDARIHSVVVGQVRI